MVVSNLTAYSLYSVMVTAYTGPLEQAVWDGQASQATVIRTLEEGESE